MRPARRTRHCGEQGLTLIEMLVGIALITVAVVGMAGAVANVQKSAQVTTDQTNLEVVARELGDYYRAPFNGDTTTTLPYQLCATSYALPSAIAGVNLPPLKSATATVTKATAATRVGAAAPFPLQDCNTQVVSPQQACSGPPLYCDWGVQRITITVTALDNRTLVRVVYKPSST
jgi:prepilin-type N-terminal cleavage/methylation domain-containing protein